MESWRAAGRRQCYKDRGGRERGLRGDRQKGEDESQEGKGLGGGGVSGSSCTGVGDALRILGSVVRETVLVRAWEWGREDEAQLPQTSPCLQRPLRQGAAVC